ncbi:hypothetical protein [Cupriavidus lacunae]|uniref:hypothetical protein n=1 Tax=Cupriavidus lacunae TaxID=2666307 RepID=UPI00142DCB1F|nr:hypothetical protein [Cupriavidus lacunae]
MPALLPSAGKSRLIASPREQNPACRGAVAVMKSLGNFTAKAMVTTPAIQPVTNQNSRVQPLALARIE